MTAATPSTVEQYLDALRSALRGADKALVQDALYDAEEHLRAELAQRPGEDEATVLAGIVASYGAPEEVAEAYRSNEATVQKALRTPPPRPHSSTLGRFFGVYADPRAYLSLLYMLLALVTGIFYFTFAVTGLSLSARSRDPDHRRAFLPAVRRHDSHRRPRRGPAGRDHARHAHAETTPVQRP